MSPAQLGFNGNMDEKEHASSTSIDTDMDESFDVTPEKETCRYSTRSQPKTPLKSTEDHPVSTTATGTKGPLKRKLEECWKETSKTKCNKEQANKSLEECTSNVELPPRKSNSAGGTCPKCKEVFEDLHSFTVHVKKHNTDETTCGICSKKLSSASSLDRHMLTHTGEKPFKCKYCPQCFTTNGNMNRHMHIHELEVGSRAMVDKKKVKTTDCNTKSKAIVEEKKVPVSKENVKASVSSKRMRTTIKQEIEDDSADAKEITDHPTVEGSPGCSREKAVEVPEQAKKESEPHTNAKVVTGFEDLLYMSFSSPKFCLVAKKACEETIRLPHSSEYSYKCQSCKKIFPCAIALNKHEAFHQGSRCTVCHDCGCHFACPQLLEEHMLKHHQPLKNNGEIGDAAFMAALGLHHKPKLLPPEPFLHKNIESDRNESESLLSACNYNTALKFERPGWLGNLPLYNQFKNSTENVDKSDVTDNMGMDKSLEPTAEDIIRQQGEESTIEKDVAPVCAASLEKNANIDMTSVKFMPMQVNVTQESSNDFADITSIISNVAVTTGTSSESTDLSEALHTESGSEVDNCSVQNYVKSSKKKVRKISKSGSKQLHSCSLCDYKSTEKSSLMRHMLTHDKERPFKCTLCQMTFTTKSNGERHAKTIHKLPKQELISVIDYNLKVSTSDGKVKTCKYCDKVFENNRGLQHHLRSVTSSCSQKPFICGKCKRGCSTKNNCIRHFQNAHRDLLNELSSDNADGRKLQDFIIVNKHKRIREQQRKLIAANDAEESACIGDSSNSETSSYDSPSPMPEQQCSFNDDDRVNAAECLVSLAEGLTLPISFESVPQEQVIEDSPLDLSVRAMDLSERKSVELLQRQSVGHFTNESSTSLNAPFSFEISSPSNLTSTKTYDSTDYSSFSTPLNLTRKKDVSSDISPVSPVEENTSTPMTYLSVANCRSFPSTSKDTCVTPTPQMKGSKTETQHVCTYCDSKFTQKSNKDRHIRNFHPEHAKPRRNKNFTQSTHTKSTSKQASSTLSNATREAILSRVLQHSDNNKQSQIESNHSMDIVIKEEPDPEEGINSDLENVDLASVSSVINTANSPTFTQYLTEDINCNSYNQSTGNQSAIEPPQKKIKISKSDNEKPLSCDFPLCEKTFNCRSSLKRHSVIHTGERAFECQFCFKQFTTNSNMVRHISNKHKASSSHQVISSATCQSPWHAPSTSAGPINLSCSEEFVLHETGLKIKQNLGELCVSPATRREYPEPNHSPTLPETSQAAMPFTEGESQSLECTFCSTTYKTEDDRWNHVKQLHPLEYERMHGKNVNLPDIMSIWKKNGCAKLKRNC